MSNSDSKTSSETNWSRVSALTDAEIDTSDTPPLDEAFFSRARLRLPPPTEHVEVTLHLDPQVLSWFQRQGPEYEHVVNAALRIYAEAHAKYVPAARKGA